MLILNSFTAWSYSKTEYFKTRDSLQARVNKSTNSAKADALFLLIRHITPYEKGSFQNLINEMKALNQQLDYPQAKAYYLQNMGDYYYYYNDLPKALDSYLQAIKIFVDEGNFKEAGMTYFRTVLTYYFTGNAEKIELYFPQAIRNFELCSCKTELAIMYYYLGYYHTNFNIQTELAQEYLHLAMKLGRESKLPSMYFAGFYSSLALSYRLESKNDSSIILLQKSNQLLGGNTNNDLLHKIINYNSLGISYENQQLIDSAIVYYNKSTELSKEISYLYLNTRKARALARIYANQGQNHKAIEYYNLSLLSAKHILESGRFYAGQENLYSSDWLTDAWPGVMKVFSTEGKRFWARGEICESYRQKANLLKTMRLPNEALEAYAQYHAYSDTLRIIEKSNELFNLELSYESDLKDNKIERLSTVNELQTLKIKQNNVFLYGLSILLLLVIFIAILLIRQNKLKTWHENTLLQQKLLRSQMNPHFIFNSMASIQNSILNDDPETASNYLARFSKLIRNILDNSIDESISIQEEINTIENYLALQKIRYHNKFEYKVVVDEKLDTETNEMPPMLGQPFIENAIEHAFSNKTIKGNIQVSFSQINASLLYEISDDGIGINEAMNYAPTNKSTYKSRATNITEQRIKVINKKRKTNILLSITDESAEANNKTGTTVVFQIPLNNGI